MREPGKNRRPDWDLAVVVGAGGMGVAVARRLAQRQRVLILDLDTGRAEQVAATLREEGGDVEAMACDVTDRSSIAAMVSRVAAMGGFRTLVHVAGLSPSMGDFDRIIRVNLNGPAWVAEALLPLAGVGSAFILIASLAAHNFDPSPEVASLLRGADHDDLAERLRTAVGSANALPQYAYPLSKYGLRMMAQRYAARWGEQGARIVTLSPGIIATPMGTAEFANSEGKSRMYAMTPLKRDGTMHEIADAVAFLASDRASFISGTDLLVDGGLSGRIATGKA